MENDDMHAVIESQEDAITRLQHRVDVMKKATKLERTKNERLIKCAQEELDAARTNLEAFEARASEKEKIIRSQFLEMKQLKRSLNEVITQMQMNQQLNVASGNRLMSQPQHFSVSKNGRTIRESKNHNSAEALLGRLGLPHSTLHSSNSKASSDCISPFVSSSTGLKHHTTRGPHHHRYAPCPPPSMSHTDPKAPRRSRDHSISLIKSPRQVQNREGEEVRYEDVDPLSFESLHQTSTDVEDSPNHPDSELGQR